jgi:predicted DNA-binding transcriptional regulator AlpA
MQQQHQSETRYLTATQLRARWGGVSHMFLERRLKDDPNFPKPIRLSASASAWRLWALDDVEAYERACATRSVPARKSLKRRRGGQS